MISLILELQNRYFKNPEGNFASPASHIGQQGRATTWHAFNKDNVSDRSRAVRSEPTRIRPTYPFPSLHLIQGADSGDELEEDYVYTDRSKDKLVWVDALNKWVPQKQLHPRPYLSFVGNPPVVEKQVKPPRDFTEGEGRHSALCWLGDAHSYISLAWQKDYTPNPTDIDPRHLANNEKREAIRRRAQELAEQRRQRKAYSSPHYKSESERKQTMKHRVQSSKTHSSLPVSPVQRKEKVPSPKQVWQAEEGPKLKTVREQKPLPHVQPVKREISITLVSPQPEEQVAPEEVEDKDSDKRVSFDDEGKAAHKTGKEKKTKEEDFDPSLEDSESKLAEQRLIESLEKQRQQQMLEQQKLLAEQQRKEMEQKEKERLAEEERLKKMREAQNMQKQPLSAKSQNQENHYENTMNAAGLLFSKKGPEKRDKVKQDEQINDKVPVKKDTKKTVKQTVDTQRNAKNIFKSKENSSDSVQKVVKVEEKSKTNVKNTPTKQKKMNVIDRVIEIENGPEKIINSLDRIEEGLEIDETDWKVKVTQAKKKKGKGTAKSKTKPEKVEKAEKAPKKVKKVEEELPKEVKLPITKPSEIEEPDIQEEIQQPQSPVQEPQKSTVPVEQRVPKEIVKKERRERKCLQKIEDDKKRLPPAELRAKKVEKWIFEAEDFSKSKETELVSTPELAPLPSLSGDLNPEFIEQEKRKKKEQRRKSLLQHFISGDKAGKKLRRAGELDRSYADELRRLELAEERRKKQMEMYEKLKNRNLSLSSEKLDDGSPRFEDYGFLSKYCIFTRGNIEMYRHAFDAVDETGAGWLEGEDVMIALRGVNNKLTEAEEEYLYRVLELTGFKITHGADFKMFSVLAALSHKISALDKWMKNLIGKMDFKALEMKMFKCKTLWECNVDKDTNSISIDQLCVELRAGGVSFEHETEVREKLSHLHALDLLDFLTYVPLFIMIHESVVENPLDNTRNK